MTRGIFLADRGGTLQGRGYDFGGGGASVTTIFGYNYNSDSSFQTIAGRKAQFSNRVPCVRIYSGGRMSSTFSISANTAQEKRAAYSFKGGGDDAGLAAGNYNTSMISWLESIPVNWTIFWTYHHEVNSSSGLEVPLATYLAVYHQMRLCLNAANLASGVQVFITCNFMGFQLGSFQQSWIPPRADCDILSWDLYGNPGTNTSPSGSNKYGGPATGSGYGTTYPLVSTRLAPMFEITQAAGYADSWGLLEVNSPLRNWDDDESGRVLWTQDYISTCLAPPMTGAVPPKVMLLWEAPSGANWDQEYGSNRGGNNPGTNTAYSNRASSPMWDVWYPYITGTPVGG
ncbi:MAG TPA: hypothetical protein VFV01_16940 [Spirillospora sp.]|nr:hypothetical protein [Spirillospora sp.]